MPRWGPILRNAAIAAAVLAYAILSHFVAAAPPPAGIGAVMFAVAPLFIVIAIGAWRSPYRILALALCAAVFAALWIYADAIGRYLGLVYFIQHVATNAALGLIFGRSLVRGREPLCSRLAAIVRGPLQPPVARYTRQVTVAWTIFFAAMSVTSTLLFFYASIQVWSAFANLLTMPLVAAMFIAEYAVRRLALPDFPRTDILESLRAYRNSAGYSAPPPQ